MTPRITFIAPAHNESRHSCAFVESMLNQKDPNWIAIVFHNGPNPDMKQWIESYKDNRLIYEESAMDTGMWGTTNRQQAVKYLVETEYVINTSIQDYWLPNAVAEISNVLQYSPDIVSWQAINHLFRYGILTGEVAYGHIDWGQWCVRTEYLKKVGIVKGNEFSSDWHTLQGIIKEGLVRNAHKIDKVLTIHN